jgi:hypothetical protein
MKILKSSLGFVLALTLVGCSAEPPKPLGGKCEPTMEKLEMWSTVLRGLDDTHTVNDFIQVSKETGDYLTDPKFTEPLTMAEKITARSAGKELQRVSAQYLKIGGIGKVAFNNFIAHRTSLWTICSYIPK